MTDDDRSRAPAPPAAAAYTSGLKPRARREITSAELLGNGREIHILHADEVYTLRQTNKGKLILTK